MAELTFEDYVKLLTTDEKAEIRANAAWRIGRTRDVRSIQPLINASSDESPLVRSRVMEALGIGIKDGVVLPALLVGLHDEDTDVRAMAARSLGQVGNDEAVEPLLMALNDPEPMVRAEIAQALGFIPSDQASLPLVTMLIEDGDSTVRHFARQSLVHIGGDSVTDAVVPMLTQYHNDAPILIELIEVLAQIFARPCVPALRNLENHPDDGVQATAKWALNILNKSSSWSESS